MQPARVAAAVLLLAALCASVGASSSPARSLLQSGTSCPNQIPACTPRRCTTRTVDGVKDRYVCLRCKAGYVPVLSSNRQSIIQCICPAGTSEVSGNCVPCQQGSYCPGGNKRASNATDDRGTAISCNPGNSTGLTTRSAKATKRADCVALGGYVLPKNANDPAIACTGNSYSPSNNRLSACLKCQSGLQAPTNYNGSRSDRNQVCQVPPGRFWELNVVRDCPKGLYRDTYRQVSDRLAIACLPCPRGWTTAGIATVGREFCNVLVAGYKVKDVEAGTNGDATAILPQSPLDPIAETEECPVGYYFDGTSTAVFGCVQCPGGSTTKDTGSISVADCMVPPGYFVNNGTLAKCTEGYRPGWVALSAAGSCLSCGSGIKVNATEPDERADAEPTSLVAATASKSCYIEAGWGITFDPEDFTKFRAIAPCPANTYGVANTTYGLINAPCKACTKNTFSAQGSTSFQDCKNQAGFGYTSEGANQCPPGWWAAAGSMEPCVQCPFCRTTAYAPGNGSLQASEAHCLVAPGCGIGFGNDPSEWDNLDGTNGTAGLCPIGSYSTNTSDAGPTTTNPTCELCPAGTSTSQPGATECDVCAPGYGDPAGTSVADCAACPYGTYSDGDGVSCTACPQTVFNHEYGASFTSPGVTFAKGQTTDATCVPRFAQLPNPAGHMMALDESMFTNSTSTLLDCVQTCPADKVCIQEFHSDQDEGTGTCKRATLTPVADTFTGAKLYYKLPPSELIAAASANTTTTITAKTQSSGIYVRASLADYAQLAENGAIGTSPFNDDIEQEKSFVRWDSDGCTTEASCKTVCDAMATCWGFINVPNKGFAIRGGEMQVGVRTFVASPDPVAAAPGLDMSTLKW